MYYIREPIEKLSSLKKMLSFKGKQHNQLCSKLQDVRK